MNNIEINPFANIPLFVLNDKELGNNEKILYLHILSLSKGEYGYCFASNAYLAEKMSTSISSIKRWLKNLIDRNYVSSEIRYKESSKEIEQRRLRVTTLNFIENTKRGRLTGELPQVHDRAFIGSETSLPQLTDEPDNNSKISNTYNNISYIGKDENSLISAPKKSNSFIAPTLDEVKNFIAENNISIDAEQFYYHYESNGWMVGKTKMKDWHCAVRYWARNSKSFNNAPKKRKNGLF